jgi:hypothetical protein
MYVIEKPAVAVRLQRRYQILVKQHLRSARSTATGLRVNTKDRKKSRQATGFAPKPDAPPRTPQQQARKAAEVAAQRFYDNPRLDLPTLAGPLLAQTHRGIAQAGVRYALCVHDQSPLHYTRHAAKTERKVMTNKDDLGYEMASALVLAEHDGAPLGVPYLALATAAGVHSTRRVNPLPLRPWVDEVNRTMNYLQAQQFTALLVHLIDRELDKVLQLRRMAHCGHLFIIRANDVRRVQHNGGSRLLAAVEATLNHEFKDTRDVQYHGKTAQQFVAETTVTLDQPARRVRQRNGQTTQRTIPGAPLTLRLVVAEVRALDGAVLATWRLWTNLGPEVSAATIALWYYWRWRIESFHKLLKSGSQALEQWQQENVQRIARRLLVAAQACVIAWTLAQDQSPEGTALRTLVIRLSGHAEPRPGADLAPIIMAGLWNLLAMIDALDDYDAPAIRHHGTHLYAMLGLKLDD